MKAKTIFAILIVVSMLITSVGFAADDGPLFKRNVSRTPNQMTGASQMSVMSLYVDAQSAGGTLLSADGEVIEYLAGDCTNTDTAGCEVVETMTEAKPLIATYNDGAGEVDLGTGAGFGERDAFAALSLDDGATWKNYNLSDSATRSSFTLKNGHAYPGDVFKVMHNVTGNRIAVAYISRYCESGSPLYSWEETDQLLVGTTYGLGTELILVEDGVTYNTYASDLFSVAGAQKSVDYTLQGFPEVGEIPYGCVWVDRGTLEEVDPVTGELLPGSGIYDIVWRAPERLTSGRRDANRVEITGVSDAGFIISWQEDPEGLRPGKGLGPGEGWSGAIANSKTDIWYSYVTWDLFDDVCTDDPDTGICAAGALADLADLATKPKVAVPFAVPMRLTDNNMCKADPKYDTDGTLLDAYCYADFDGNQTADLCATSEPWESQGGTSMDICVAEDGRLMSGQTASTRIRWAMKPYTNAEGETSAWVLMGEEKMKALGDPDLDDEDIIDIGKNMWYHTFEWNAPELVAQGLMLNAPAIDPASTTGDPFPVLTDERGNEFWETEISRRFNLMVQGIGSTVASDYNTSAILIYKEGILNQGGPADIFTRRVVYEPEDYGSNDFTGNPTSDCTGITDFDEGEDDPAIANITGSVSDSNDDPVACLSLDLVLGVDDGAGNITWDIIPSASLFTDAEGTYLFQDIPAGIYKIVVTDQKRLLEEYDPLAPTELEIAVEDSDVPDADIQLSVARITCDGIKDADGDDIDDADSSDISGSVGVECVSVDLLDADGVLVDTVLTDADGVYLFQDYGSVGTYSIAVTDIYDLLESVPADTLDVEVIAENPFAYENVECVEYDDLGNALPVDLLYTDGSNPNYVRGLCPAQGMNISGTTIVACDGTDGDCAADFPWDADVDESGYPKVTEWIQAPDNFNDPSWANPYDVSKGHRGFIDGDFVMMMYATAPNWKANTTGNEAYNLYIRRSFDGGQTWTTLPASYAHIDGTTWTGDGTCSTEWYGWGGQDEMPVEVCYDAGAFEQARNVSRLTGSKITVLDPRYSPTGGMLKLDIDDVLCYGDADGDGVSDWENCGYTIDDAVLDYAQELRDPSAYFVTYETGDNTVVTVETGAVPMDMYYSKATNFGDDYDEIDACIDSVWYPNSASSCESGETDVRWDWLENGDELATEASVYGNPAGTKFYAVWNQELEISPEHFTDMDTEFRRMYWNLTDVDVAPDASILYVSTDRAAYDDEDIVLIGSARDHDNLGEGDGISNYRWWVDATGHEYNERTWQAPPNGFIPGKHDFSFAAQDNEGNWSQPKTVTIWIAEQFYDTYLPLVTR